MSCICLVYTFDRFSQRCDRFYRTFDRSKTKLILKENNKLITFFNFLQENISRWTMIKNIRTKLGVMYQVGRDIYHDNIESP